MKQLQVRFMRLAAALIAVALVWVAGGCTMAVPESGAPGNEETAAMPTVTPGEVTVTAVRSNATAPGAANGSAYLTVLNGTEESIRLLSVEANVAEAAELHETINDEGVMRMVAQPEGFEVEPGASLMLEPGGKHVMLLGLHEPLAEGEAYDLTLNFQGTEPVSVSVPVLPIGVQSVDHGQMDNGEMGPDAEMAEPPAWVTQFQALDVSALHQIDDALNVTGTLDAGFAETVQTFRSGLTAIDWPEELSEQVDELDAALTELDAALLAEDLESAGALATDVHAVAHDLEHSIESHLGGEEHGEHEDGAAEGDHHAEDAHDGSGHDEHEHDEHGEHEHEEEDENGESGE